MQSLNSSLTDEYFAYYEEYKQKYGENICILMQIGSFYEIKMVKNENEDIGNLDKICNILNIQITRSNKNIIDISRSNPYMAGFPIVSLNKFLPLLLENGYTVVVIDQDDSISSNSTKKTRKISGIYSPSIQPYEYNNISDNNLTSIIIEILPKDIYIISISILNMTTNEFHLYELYSNKTNYLDDIYRIIIRYTLKEINIFCNKKIEINTDFLINYLEINDKTIHWNTLDNEYNTIHIQNNFLRNVYKHINFGLLEPIEFFDLEKTQLCVKNIIYTINFIAQHVPKYINNISTPKLINEYNHLVLEMNTLQQLNIIGSLSGRSGKYGSLFDVINKTTTIVGKRGLKNLLCKPFKNISDISFRYELSEQFENSGKLDDIIILLKEVYDFEKLHRKMSLGLLHPYEFDMLNMTYNSINKLIKLLSASTNIICDENQINTNLLNEYIENYTQVFDLEKMRKCNMDSKLNYFNIGQKTLLDELSIKIKTIENDIENYRTQIENLFDKKGKQKTDSYIKLGYTEQDGHFFTCTKIRGQLLQQKCKNKEDDFQIKFTTNTCKITSENLNNLSIQLSKFEEILSNKIKLFYIEQIEYYSNRYSILFTSMKNFIELIDITVSNIKCKNLYNYCKPIIVEGDSFFDAKELRHPIIERINTNTKYIPNDLLLNNDTKGIILFSVNSGGKSSMLRSVGLCIVLAQCGLYVPCESFTYSPFSTLITQVDLLDNIWKSQSSFIAEMIGLNKIMKVANKNCLILADEVCKGTEVLSATSIFASSVLQLLQKNAKFIYTTHLHDLIKINEIKSNKFLQICHLSISIVDSEIIFNRKLLPGSCGDLYGLEIARAIGLPDDMMNMSFKIREQLTDEKIIITPKKSKYNSKKIVDKCEICSYAPKKKSDKQLHTHHIQFQKDFEEHQKLQKNNKSNLVILCDECHTKLHNNEIIINGYVQTTNGVKLNSNTASGL